MVESRLSGILPILSRDSRYAVREAVESPLSLPQQLLNIDTEAAIILGLRGRFRPCMKGLPNYGAHLTEGSTKLWRPPQAIGRSCSGPVFHAACIFTPDVCTSALDAKTKSRTSVAASPQRAGPPAELAPLPCLQKLCFTSLPRKDKNDSLEKVDLRLASLTSDASCFALPKAFPSGDSPRSSDPDLSQPP